jgi:glycosyltransferase involved in cell wall biosynthesis
MSGIAPQVVVSNGYSQFHMSHLAAELYTTRTLVGLITGAYPRAEKPRRHWRRSGLYRRYLARRVPVPPGMVWPIWSGETLSQASLLLWRLRAAETVHSAVANASLVRYQRAAANLLREQLPRGGHLYHFRSGFGGVSVQAARDLGMKVVCDHSIVHPALLEGLLQNGGRLTAGGDRRKLSSFWSTVEQDLSLADVILVNSHFVQDTFVQCGIERERTRVIYWGPDQAFLDELNRLPANGAVERPTQGPLRVLAAGTMEERKGSHILAEALGNLPKAELDVHVVGNWHRRLPKHRRRLESIAHVRLSPGLGRAQLAQAMADADVFVLPTLAEGSARVIFEALAAGCYIVTTPNAGSIVRDGVHGRLIQPGSVAQLGSAIEEARDDLAGVRQIGCRNALAVRAEYGPGHYSQRVTGLYQSLLADG